MGQAAPAAALGRRRVITYDRRGAGGSSQPATGYDWDAFAADRSALIDKLGLDGVTLVGHSVGTGEVTRYLSSYGSAKVDRAVLIGPIPPFLSQAPDNPDGVPANLFDGFRQSAAADTPAWLKGFLDNFYNINQFGVEVQARRQLVGEAVLLQLRGELDHRLHVGAGPRVLVGGQDVQRGGA